METLNKFTPAEVYLIRKNGRVKLRHLIKLTLADLLVKNVLGMVDRHLQPHPRDPVRILTFVGRGPEFKNYIPKPHEELLLKPFKEPDSEDLTLQRFVNATFDHCRYINLNYRPVAPGIALLYRTRALSARYFIFNFLLKNRSIKPYFNNTFYHEFLYIVSLTREGQKVKKNINHELSKLAVSVPQLIKTDDPSTTQILQKIKGHVFLLPSMESALINKIDDAISAELNYRAINPRFTHGGERWLPK